MLIDLQMRLLRKERTTLADASCRERGYIQEEKIESVGLDGTRADFASYILYSSQSIQMRLPFPTEVWLT